MSPSSPTSPAASASSSTSCIVISPDRRPSPLAEALLECEPEAVLLELLPPPNESLGPLKLFRLRLAKSSDGRGLLNGLGEPGGCGRLDELAGMVSLKRFMGGPVPRTRRRWAGNAVVVGVAGSTLTE